MHYRRLGRSGLKVSEISLGSWVTIGNQIDELTSINLIKEAFAQGINFFDNADMYAAGQAEIVMGKAIADLAPRGAGHLDQSILADDQRSQWARSLAQACDGSHQRQPQALGHRVCRSVFLPPL